MMRKQDLDLNEVLYAIAKYLIEELHYDIKVRDENMFTVMNSKPKISIYAGNEDLIVIYDNVTLLKTQLYNPECVDKTIKFLEYWVTP